MSSQLPGLAMSIGLLTLDKQPDALHTKVQEVV